MKTTGHCSKCGILTAWFAPLIKALPEPIFEPTPREVAGQCSTCWLKDHPGDKKARVGKSVQEERSMRVRVWTQINRDNADDPRDKSGPSPFNILDGEDEEEESDE